MKIKVQVNRGEKAPNWLIFLLFLIPTFGVYLLLNFFPKAKISEGGSKLVPSMTSSLKLPPLHEKREPIQNGRTLSDILEQYNFSPTEIHKLRQDVKPVYDLAKIIAGKELRLSTFEDGSVVALEYDIDQDHFLHIEKKEGGYYAQIKKIPIEKKIRLICGTIDDFLISAMEEYGERSQLAINLENIFAWDIDFRADLRQGDSFKVIFEKKYREDELIGYGKILAAEFTCQNKLYQAFRYTYNDTNKSDYYDIDGNSLRKEFLKSPLLSPRITSRFSHRRYHPVRKTYRPHFGVDFGAPVGTRVYATADGVVMFAGWNGASGRMLRMRHKKGYETMYLHLRRFAPGIKKGARVEGGQYIAQVGASGEVNGPHLDYRIKHYGTYINPLAARFDPVTPLRKEFLGDFWGQARYYKLCFDSPILIFAAFSNSSPPSLSTGSSD